VTSKIVSKAEGRLVDVPADGPERDAARAEVLAAETARVVARRGPTTIVQTHHGFVMAAAGIDASNVDKTHLVLLPADPDASARALHAALAARGLHVGVIVSDTMGRAWRNGLTDVALGAAGIAPLRDHRGEIDPYGNELELTQMAVVDELAAAGDLVKGKRDQVPVAVVRGYPGAGAVVPDGAAVLLRDAASDMFSLGTAEARAAGLRDAATLDDPAPGAGSLTGGPVDRPAADPAAAAESLSRGPVDPPAADPAAVERALALVAFAPGTQVARVGDSAVRISPPADATPAALMRLGADAHRVRAALAAEGIASTLILEDAGLLLALSPA
jgi:coenzyme F420-0:L-glutamate ligase/coenzyme F420-1:gamma-L-glutamate ligase